MREAEELLTIGNILKGLAETLAVKAIIASVEAAAYALDPFTWILSGIRLEQAGIYAAGAIAAGATGINMIKSGLSQKAEAEAEYNRNIALADRDAQRKLGNSGSGGSGASSNNGRSISGSITAQELKITIAPSITIQGEYINISNTGIEEASRILGDGMVNRIQEAIDNKELNLVNAVN